MSTILITGGHSGIGLACAGELASGRTVDILFAGRSPQRMQEAADGLKARYGVAAKTIALDTSSMASVRAAAQTCRAMIEAGEIGPLQAILCNAGGRYFGAPVYSTDGYEQMFAANYLGHFLLVELLIDCLPDDGRVVFTASGTHDPDTADGKMVGPSIEPDAIMLANAGKDGGREVSSGARYATSKLCTVMQAYELDRRLRRNGSNITSIAYDPGLVSGSAFLRGLPAPVRWMAGTSLAKRIMKRRGITMGSLEFSGASLARIATDPAFAASSGKYLQANGGVLSEATSARISYDEALAARLWNDSKNLVGLKPEEECALLE